MNQKSNFSFFANRDLDLKQIKVIGYDMDYTLIHYHVTQWEEKAYEHTLDRLIQEGWPLKHLKFKPELTKRGLVLDLKRGNILKVDEFGCVNLASHGTRELSKENVETLYGSTLVDLGDPYYEFLNTLFSISTGCLYAQLVDELDARKFKEALSYRSIFEALSKAQNMAHLEGRLKDDITSHPKKFVDLDSKLAETLLDQKNSGKKLFLATNSDWSYTDKMMKYALDPFLEEGMGWRNLFDLVIVAADKPSFFGNAQKIFSVNTEENHLKPHYGKLKENSVYHGGCALDVENFFSVSGREILYVGDHIYSDINIAKKSRRWHTALVLRELEQEMSDLEEYQSERITIALEKEKQNKLEEKISHYKLKRLHLTNPHNYKPKESLESLTKKIEDLEKDLEVSSEKVAHFTKILKNNVNSPWGFLMRVENSRSLIAKQIAKHADIYSSRVSNFREDGPYRHFKSEPALFPHDHKKLREIGRINS